MKRKYPLMLTGYRSVQSFTSKFSITDICFEKFFLFALTWNKFLLMKSDNCEGRYSTVCETNPLENDKYQKVEMKNMSQHILFYLCTKFGAFNPKPAIPIIFYTNLLS